MNRWNPNLFLREGERIGLNPQYLKHLVETGRCMQAHNVPVIFSLAHLANLSKTLYSDLHGFVSRSGHLGQSPYKSFPISKRSGGKRWISIPIPPLMAVQGWIAKNILNSVEPHPAAFAYATNRRIKDHAGKHCGADWILKIDITDFFSNISERQIYGVFMSLGYPRLLSFEMARLCTRITPRRLGKRWGTEHQVCDIEEYYCQYVGSLPQGAPTSPALSNLVFIVADRQLEEVARNVRATYSRYADDLCFSFTHSNRREVFAAKKQISEVLWSNGFRENSKKTRIIPPGARKILTGLVVNGDMPSIPKELRDTVKMHLYYCKKLGIPAHCRNRDFRSVIGFKRHLYGLIMYVNSISAEHGRRFMDQYSELPWLEFDI